MAASLPCGFPPLEARLFLKWILRRPWINPGPYSIKLRPLPLLAILLGLFLVWRDVRAEQTSDRSWGARGSTAWVQHRNIRKDGVLLLIEFTIYFRR